MNKRDQVGVTLILGAGNDGVWTEGVAEGAHIGESVIAPILELMIFFPHKSNKEYTLFLFLKCDFKHI